MEKEMMEKNRNLQDQLILMDCKLLDNLRFRGVPEMKGDVRQEMVNIVSEFMEKSQEEVEGMCDEIYRVNSEFACEKKTT